MEDQKNDYKTINMIIDRPSVDINYGRDRSSMDDDDGRDFYWSQIFAIDQ